MPSLDAVERPRDLGLERAEHAGGVVVGALADLGRLVVGGGDDPPALVLGGLGQPALLDQVRGLLLGARDDPLGLLLGLVDDPLALLVDALRGADLLGHGDAQLVDQVERGVAVDDRVARERQRLAVRDQRLEPLDEEDDVQRTASLGSGAPTGRCQIMARDPETYPAGPPSPAGQAAASAAAAASGTIAHTSPPNWAISFTRLELMYECSSEVMKNTVSTSGGELVVVVGELELRLEVRDRPQAADEERRARLVAEVHGQAVERRDVHPARRAPARRRARRGSPRPGCRRRAAATCAGCRAPRSRPGRRRARRGARCRGGRS